MVSRLKKIIKANIHSLDVLHAHWTYDYACLLYTSLLDSTSFTLLIVYAFITMTRTNDAFIAAYGLFQDIYAPAIEDVYKRQE